MRLGLYRYTEGDGGECACVDWRAGDGAPFLDRGIYELLGFEPRFEALPPYEAFAARRGRAPVPLCLQSGVKPDLPVISG